MAGLTLHYLLSFSLFEVTFCLPTFVLGKLDSITPKKKNEINIYIYM